MPEHRSELYALLSQVRTCFNLLKTLAETLHADSGISPSMRAVLEALHDEDRQTVPAIARAKGVSRQHIQTIADALQAAGHVCVVANPAHRRSPLLCLTKKGRGRFADIRRRETAPLARLAAAVPSGDLGRARGVLADINRRLVAEISKGAKSD